MKELTLKQVKAFAMLSTDNEWNSSIKGYYKDRVIAENAAIGAGWYGSNGSVSVVDVYTDGKEIYTVKSIGQYADDNDGVKTELLKNIKSKLSRAELELLGINPVT